MPFVAKHQFGIRFLRVPARGLKTHYFAEHRQAVIPVPGTLMAMRLPTSEGQAAP